MKIICFSLLIAAMLIVAGCTSSPTSQPTRILWLGSSSTYVHDLPLQTGNWLQHSDKFDSVETHLMGRSGTGFHEYLRPGFKAQYGLKEGQTLLEKIRDEAYNYVVIQQITYFMADSDSVQIIDDTELLGEAIRASGAKPVFYEMGWRLEPLNETGRQMILREAKKNDVTLYAPCSSAWTRVRAERPDIELHNVPDTDHPGTLGTYLNMCCFYVALTGKKPENLPTTIERWPLFGSFDKDEARQRLAQTQLHYYHAAMPTWMQAISNLRWEVDIDPEVADYLQTIAWETWQDKHAKRTETEQ